ncbi:MAG: hypothetical protein V4706_17355 [Pseudomonadota bacterium]
MQPKYEEKTFESYFNSELDRKASIYFPFGQVQEGGIGADAAGLARSRSLWWRLGHPYFFRVPFPGADLREIADEMERHLGREIKNIPRMKANLLFQYKRPEFITTKLGTEWAHWGQKYFRYDVDQDQQRLLAHVASKFGTKALVLYASPALEDVSDLVSAKISGTIIASTNFRPAVELSAHHRNTYVKSGTHSIACSDPVQLENFDLLTSLKRLRTEDAEEAREDNAEFMLQFAKGVRALVSESSYLGGAYRRMLEPYIQSQADRYPLFFSVITMSIFRELSGAQWLVATANEDA